jgi:HAD superfamily hydrolase (TIGR01509 family)
LPDAAAGVSGDRLGLVIFDCDGVLIDSEPASRELLAEEAAAIGLAMTPDEAGRFTGLTWSAIQPRLEAEIGRALPADWVGTMQARLARKLASGVKAIPGARALLQATAALGLPYRVASNSSHQELSEKMAVTGLADLVAGRVHSAQDVARGKPAPDLFLAAAAAEAVPPAACLVVEDSAPGITAAQAAGMRVVAFAPHGLPGGLARPPDAAVRRLEDLPDLFGAAMAERAA